jgi:hypothetical protein
VSRITSSGSGIFPQVVFLDLDRMAKYRRPRALGTISGAEKKAKKKARKAAYGLKGEDAKKGRICPA